MYRGDDRGQSIQIGAVLLFGALIVALASYQAFVVPQQNEQVEFSHSQTVQNQLLDLRNAVGSMTGEAAPRSVAVTLGTAYPPRIVAMNPGPPTGSLRTAGTTDPDVAFEVANARAAGETGDFWTGSDVRVYGTGSVVYRPNYNVYEGAPTTRLANSVLVNEFPGSSVARSGQTLVDGNRVTLVAVNGSLGRTRAGAVSVDVRPVSASTRTVSVTNPDPGSPVTLRVPTRLDRETWLSLLDDQMGTPDGHVQSVDVVDVAGSPVDTLVVELEPGENYTLAMAKVGVGSGVGDENRSYLTDVAGNGSTVTTDGRANVVVEVRDRFNNPVAGVTLQASPSDGSLTAIERTTDADGRATFTLNAPASTGPVDVNVSFSGNPAAAGPDFDSETVSNATVTVLVQSGTGGGGGGSGPDYVVTWRDAGQVAGEAVNPAASCPAIPCEEPVDLGTLANPPEAGKVVTYYTNDTTLAELDPTVGATDGAGEHDTALTLFGAGDVRLSASNTSGADHLLVDTLLASTFEDNADDWTEFGTFEAFWSTERTDGGASNRGNWAYRIDGGNPGGIETADGYDTTDAELVTIEYWALENGPEGDEGPGGDGEDLVVEYLPAGGNPGVDADWVEIDRLPAEQDGTDEYTRRARLTAADAFHGNFRVRFRQVGADAFSDEWYVDDVQVRAYTPVDGVGGGGGGGNQAPTADAGPDRTVDEGGSVTLDGTGSSDSDGTVSSYSWAITSGPGSLSGADTATPTYTAPADVAGDTAVTVELTVTDDDGSTDTDAATVTVTNAALTYNDDAVAVDGPDDDGTAGGVEFSFTNDFGQNLEITSLQVGNPGGQARLNDEETPNGQPRRAELYVAADVSDGWVDVDGGTSLPVTFDMDADGFDNGGNPETSSGGTVDVSLFEFENNGGNRIDMSGNSFEVTVTYELADGTTGTKTVTVDVA